MTGSWLEYLLLQDHFLPSIYTNNHQSKAFRGLQSSQSLGNLALRLLYVDLVE